MPLPPRQFYVDLALKAWLNSDKRKGKVRLTQKSLMTTFQRFKDELNLDPVQLLFDARRTQNPTPILKVLDLFETRLIEKGLKQSTARQYVANMRGFFSANRFPLSNKAQRRYQTLWGKSQPQRVIEETPLVPPFPSELAPEPIGIVPTGEFWNSVEGVHP